MLKAQVQKLQTLTGHRVGVYTLQPGASAHQVFSAAGDGMVVLWDIQHPEEGELIAKLPNSIYALHRLPFENLLVAGHNYNGIHLLDWQSKKELASMQLSDAAIFDIQSWNGKLLIASGDGMVTIVDIASWSVYKKLLASEKSARTIAIHPEGREFAVGYSDHFIRVFDLDTMNLKSEWQAHTNSVFTLAYSPDFRRLISGSRDARLKVWRVGERYTLEVEVAAHLFAINHINFSPDGKHFVTCSMDKSIKVWDALSLQLLKVIDKARHAGHGTSVNKLLWTSFHQQLVSASDDRTISVWNIDFLN
jgi:WD40 repeat protein